MTRVGLRRALESVNDDRIATLADGLLYTMSERSNVGISKPTPKGHKLISQFKIPKQGSGPSWAHPVVRGGRLYIRHDDFLYSYDVRAN